jgi:hypothetical protein
MVPELKLAAALADDSEKVSVTSPMNFTNEQEMLVQNVDTSPSVEKNDSPYKRLSMSKKKSKYEEIMQAHTIPEQEEPSSTMLFDQSDVKIN